MIEPFAAYIKTIAAFLIFSVFSEMVAPENGYKKYLHVVLGFILLLLVIQPIYSILADENIDFLQEAVLDQLSGSEEKAAKAFAAVKTEQGSTVLLNEIYQKELAESMKETLFGAGVTVSMVEVFTEEDEDSQEYGSIVSVKVILDGETEEVEKSGTLAVNIEPVEVLPFGPAEKKAEEELEKKGANEEEIAKRLSAAYGIREEQVQVVSESYKGGY